MSSESTMTVVSTRPLWRRIAGVLLIAYGVAGLVMVSGGALLVGGSAARLDGLAATLDTQRQVLVRSLETTATFLLDARTGTGNVSTSLTAAVDSAHQTATLTRSLGTAMEQLATATSISILGSQPFAGLGGTFSSVAGQATSLGTSLDRTADSLAVNGDDLGRVHDDLGAIQAEIDSLRQQLSGAAFDTVDLQAASRALDISRTVLFGLLGWLAVQAIIAIAAGLVLGRSRSLRLVPGSEP